MIGYIYKMSKGALGLSGKYELTICECPCNGEEFNKSEKRVVSGKREAKQICKALNITPYNF